LFFCLMVFNLQRAAGLRLCSLLWCWWLWVKRADVLASKLVIACSTLRGELHDGSQSSLHTQLAFGSMLLVWEPVFCVFAFLWFLLCVLIKLKRTKKAWQCTRCQLS
jgi:hypothetical protein